MADARLAALRPKLHGEGPCIVVAHGFKGFSGWGMFPWLAGRLAEAGFLAVRFDFRFNGADENGDFTRLDLFRKNTMTHEQEDLKTIVDSVAAGSGPFAGRCPPSPVGLLGHSRGGGGAILYAATDPRVRAVATLAAIAHADRFPAAARATAEREGAYEVENARTGQRMPVGVEFFRDAPRHDVLAAARRMSQPLLLVHGTKDESVPVGEARELAAAAGDRASLLEIEGAGHTFGATHPFAGPTPHLEEAASRVVEFFAARLRN